MTPFEAFYREHSRLVFALALAQDANPTRAEDLAQETFFRAWKHFRRLSGMPSAAQRSWLARALRNLAIDHWRRERSEREAELQEAAPALELPERIALRLDVARALIVLEETDRQIVVLRYCLGMTSREIGELLRMPEGTVRSRLMQCRRYLAEKLAAWSPQETSESHG